MDHKTDEHNAGLTDEEIAALAEGGDEADEAGDAGKAGADTAEAVGKTGADEGATSGQEEEGKGAEEAPAGAEAEPEKAEAQAYKPVPLIKADAPANAETRLAEIDAEKIALAEKFDNGDMTTKEYSAALDKLTDERDDLRWSLRKNQLSEEAIQQQRQDAWFREVHTFATENPVLQSSPLIWNAFDEVVKRVGADPKTADLPDREGLELAFTILKQELGAIVGGSDKPKAAPAAPAEERKVPPTLGRIPAAALDTIVDTKFDGLDKLSESDPEKYEEMFAKMSPADQQRYLAGQ